MDVFLYEQILLQWIVILINRSLFYFWSGRVRIMGKFLHNLLLYLVRIVLKTTITF